MSDTFHAPSTTADLLREHYQLGSDEEWLCAGCGADYHNTRWHVDHLAAVLDAARPAAPTRAAHPGLPKPDEHGIYRIPGPTGLSVEPYVNEDGAFVGVDYDGHGLTLPVDEADCFARAVLVSAECARNMSLDNENHTEGGPMVGDQEAACVGRLLGRTAHPAPALYLRPTERSGSTCRYCNVAISFAMSAEPDWVDHQGSPRCARSASGRHYPVEPIY
ncbi:hypothetical protein [Mycobacteroides abscessus]|uniref:hypothetical protein n=1 Tax=Mycobacteroides abscessus TaxID=36809 RepID=UPI000C25709B|nr:hypothetical protein [Mycobacteroides abscessus]